MVYDIDYTKHGLLLPPFLLLKEDIALLYSSLIHVRLYNQRSVRVAIDIM